MKGVALRVCEGHSGREPAPAPPTTLRQAGGFAAQSSRTILRASVAFVACVLLSSCAGSMLQTRHLNVTATAYNSLPGQTSGDASVAAWGDRLEPGMKAVAVSRDLLELGLTRGVKVRIDGLPGDYVVLDKMSKRWKRRIDIYMGVDRGAAREWGRRKVRISWDPDVRAFDP